MLYVCEFEFFETEGGVCAFPCGGLDGATFGENLQDAVESAADWLACMVDDSLMHGYELPETTVGHKPKHNGRIMAVAVSRSIGDIPSMTAADAARELGVSPSRVSQLIASGQLESWRDGSKRMVSRASVEARIEESPKSGRPKLEPAL